MSETKKIAAVTQKMPLLTLRGLTVFPNMVLHFDVGREKSVKALDQSMLEGQKIFLVAQKDIRTDDPNLQDIFSVGTVSKVRQIFKLPGGTIRILVEGMYRAKMLTTVGDEPFYVAEVMELPEIPPKREALRIQALIRRAQEMFDEYSAVAPRMTHEVMVNVLSATEPGYLADYMAQNIAVKHTEKQLLLEEANHVKRLEKLCVLLKKETDILRLEADIHGRVREQLGKNQRDFYLREQLRIIRSELGDREESGDEYDEYRERIYSIGLEESLEDKLLKELKRLESMHPSSAESGVIRTYLDAVLALPWNRATKDRLNLDKAAAILDGDHFGLEKVKERILEYLAVKQLAPQLKGQVICLVGPPGVGKTSIAMSLSRALGRKLGRLSLGGIRDEAEIRGHRKTYVGAMPGRIMNALAQAGSKNAIILLDEIDKLGSDFRGDPSAALLEVLDAEQNNSFRDHYLEIPFDLSDVLFITTANSIETIPRPLLDRMELIEITSYTDEEKLQIAKRHLLPKQLKRHGLGRASLKLSDDALREIIVCYTKESGVRRLERELASCCRKAAKLIASGEAKRISVTAGNVDKYLGVRKYKPESQTRSSEVGVVCGLAWTSVGGEILEAEANIVDGKGSIELTGNLGDVMKESAKAAISFIRSRSAVLGVDPRFYTEKDIHLHFPEGAIPKDGPSAGITILTAIVSALTGVPVRGDVAMTGEITIRGRVLPIGGLKEKTMAAYRSGIKTVIIPADNASDLEEIDPVVKNALNFILAEKADEVLSAALMPSDSGSFTGDDEQVIVRAEGGSPKRVVLQ
ncbi:MAG: endopeptidase La [Oscillospiraceae bacterium]|jgi:ATP-dependent Lon protease|nr:endopeptidase La [Oscillospiraceae bacterium]